MKYLFLSILMIGVGIGVVGCEDDDKDGPPEEEVEEDVPVTRNPNPPPKLNPPYVASVTGLFLAVPNPAITKPPLPGMVDAVVNGGNEFILTSNGSWSASDEGHSWNGIAPKYGDTIIVDGTVSEHLDVYNDIYFEIEVDQLQVVTNAAPPPP